MKIKGWNKFQHFKDRRPPWIKLYRDILDDPDWHSLSGENAKILTMLWLIASDDEEKKGNLPPIKKLAFRLRITEAKLISSLQELNCWLVQDDITQISDGYQYDTPEGEGETEGETETEQKQSTAPAESKIAFGDEMENSSSLKIKQALEDMCSELLVKKIFPKVYAFKNKMLKQGKNPRAILHTLSRCYIKGQATGFDGKTPWAYCQKIIMDEDGNYNERDNTNSSQ